MKYLRAMRALSSLLASVAVALSLAACSSLACGEGTTQVGDRCVATVACGPDTIVMGDVCVPAAALECGEGTVVVGDRCVPESMLACGASTVRVGDLCVPDDMRCPAGTIQRGDACIPAALVPVRVPFASGQAVEVGQGMHGGFSHEGSQVHALDFTAAVGTMVVAARDGIVVDLREDSTTGCGDATCADQANYVRVDHGDGTYGTYLHLDTNGALVALGERVCAGEPIARVGNTGWSTAPHLHFAVVDAFGYSLPLYFEDLGDMTEGWLFAGTSITSTHVAPATCDHVIEPTDCVPDLFAHDGIVELRGMPCALADAGATYRVTGRALGASRTGQLVLRGDLDGDWSYECGTTNADGTFAIDLRFLPSRVASRAYAGVTSASRSECRSADGWDASPRIVVR